MTDHGFPRSPDWVMEFATRAKVFMTPKRGGKLAVIAAYQQDRIDAEGCGAVFAAARWPLVRKRKRRHKI